MTRSTKNPHEYALQVLMVLRLVVKHRGKGSAIKAEQIQDATGIDTRIVAEIAGLLGKTGYAVCSGPDGYFYAANQEEWNAHLEKERQRAIALLHKVKEAKKNFTDQFTLFEGKPAA